MTDSRSSECGSWSAAAAHALIAAAGIMAAAVLAACSRQAPPVPTTVAAAAPSRPAALQQSGWDAYASRFIEDYFRARPMFAVQAGRHEFDGDVPDLSAAGIAKEVKRLKEYRAETAAFNPATLPPEQRFARAYLLNVIDTDLFWLDRARSPFTNPAWYIDLLDPNVYLDRKYAPLATRMQGYIGYARAIPQVAANIRTNLRGPLPRTFIERGIKGFGGYAEFYRRDVPQVFASVQDPAAQEQLAEADEAAAQAMDRLKSWLESRRRHARGKFALGEPLFEEMLRDTDGLDVPVAKLAEIGRQDLDRNTRALAEACAKYAPGSSVAACVARERAHKPKGDTVGAATEQLAMLKAFIVRHRIVDIPSDNEVSVALAPPYNRENFAFIQVPGPYDKELASEFNVAPPDPSWSAKKREDYTPGAATLLYTSVHEVWPGHFLQFSYSNRNPSNIAALWVTYAYAEGWAHYCEEMMWDEGLGNGDPEQHVGQLTEALLRDVRFLSSIGLHTQGMTVEQSERMFLDQAFADPGDAEQQAARGTYDPAYLNYTLGKLMIRKLRDDWVARQPGAEGESDPRKYWQAFHDKFLTYGGPPIPLVRKEMLGSEAGVLY
ncbi:MAG TPA: DUF885 domain-containing protein [Steroidobacteraceae bacterium]|nr:DUF885 domain-containing protein [Steroidobacteraceae bacterium]